MIQTGPGDRSRLSRTMGSYRQRKRRRESFFYLWMCLLKQPLLFYQCTNTSHFICIFANIWLSLTHNRQILRRAIMWVGMHVFGLKFHFSFHVSLMGVSIFTFISASIWLVFFSQPAFWGLRLILLNKKRQYSEAKSRRGPWTELLTV